MAREDKTQILYTQALEFHEVVVRQRRQTQTQFAISLWKGHGKANGTMLKRLADAAVRLKIDPLSREWKYLVQESTSAAVGAALRQEDPKNAVNMIRSQMKTWEERGGPPLLVTLTWPDEPHRSPQTYGPFSTEREQETWIKRCEDATERGAPTLVGARYSRQAALPPLNPESW